MGGSRSWFVAVEGTTGVGKTTVAAAMGEDMGATVLPYPAEFRAFRQAVGLDEHVPPVPRVAYYLAAGLQLSAQVDEALRRGPVITDRYTPSPLAMLEAEGAMPAEEIVRLAGAFAGAIRVPDLTLLLVADHPTAVNRIRRRGLTGAPMTRVHRRAVDMPDFFTRWQEALRCRVAAMGPVVELDTTDAAPEDTCRLAAELVRSALVRA